MGQVHSERLPLRWLQGMREVKSQQDLNEIFLDLAEFDRRNKAAAAAYFEQAMINPPPLANAAAVRTLTCAKCGSPIYTADPDVELSGDCSEQPMNPDFPQAGTMRVHSMIKAAK